MSGYEKVRIKGLGVIKRKKHGEIVFYDVQYHARGLGNLGIPFEIIKKGIIFYREKSFGVNEFRRFVGTEYLRLTSRSSDMLPISNIEQKIIDIVLGNIESNWRCILKRECKGPMREDKKDDYIVEGFSPELLGDIGRGSYFHFSHVTSISLNHIGVVLNGTPGRTKSRLPRDALEPPPSWHNYLNNNDM